MTETAEASTDTPASTQLWSVYLIPHDEYHAAPTKEEAEAACLLINAAAARQATREQPAHSIAEARAWPYSVESYATGMADFYTLFLR